MYKYRGITSDSGEENYALLADLSLSIVSMAPKKFLLMLLAYLLNNYQSALRTRTSPGKGMQMRQISHNNGRELDRRTVLKSAAAASTAGIVGVPVMSGSAAALQGFGDRFYTVHPYKGTAADGNRYLVGFDPTPDDDDDIKAESAVKLRGELSVVGGDVIGTVIFDPSGTLYAVNSNGGHLLEIAPDGTVSHVGQNNNLKAVTASGILKPSNTPYLFGIKHDSNELVQVDLTGASTVSTNTLTVDDSFLGFSNYGPDATLEDIYGNYHNGVAVDFETERLIAVIGNSSATNNKDDLIEIATDGTVTLLQKDVISELRKIGVEFDPCSGLLYATRDGPDVWEVDVEGGGSTELGSVYIDRNDNHDFDSTDSRLNVASLGSPWPNSLFCPCEVDLLAGQDIDVGSVTTEVDGDVVTVTFETTDDWYLAETHVEVVDDPSKFPTGGNGNPKVGHFDDGGAVYGPGVQTDSFDIDANAEDDSDEGPPYYVGAHAVVYHVDCDGEGESSFWATNVLESALGTQKDGDVIPDDRDDVGDALGAPDGEFVSLGFGGSLTVEFDAPVYNAPGDEDILVGEVTFGRSSYPEEKADVMVRPVGEDSFVAAGQVRNHDDFDGSSPGVGAVGIPDGIIAIDAVKLVDATDPDDFSNGDADGYDVDAVGASCLVDQEETAWGDGCRFTDRGNWATYTVVGSDVCGCRDEGTEPGDAPAR